MNAIYSYHYVDDVNRAHFDEDLEQVVEEEDENENDEESQIDINEEMEDNKDEIEENFEKITVGICAMAKKVNSKPMEAILTRLASYNYFEIIIFPQDIILKSPITEWPKCDCLISFYSKDFPLKKAQEYAEKYNPFLINDLEKQWDIMDRIKVYQILKEAGIEQPRYAIKTENSDDFVDQEDQIEIKGQVFTKPAGGGSQRLFRKIGFRSSIYSQENRLRQNGSYIYEEFMPTDGTDVKVYTVGPEYAHAEARKSPALDGVVERDENGKEVRYPVMLRAEEKIIAKKIVLAFKQSVCGFDLLRANGKSYVCDVNGFSFVKNSTKYYDDCSSILAHMILKEIAPQRHITYNPISYQADERPIVPTTYGTMMELRCVIGVMRHGDRTPKQKMKMEVRNKLFFDLFKKYGGTRENNLKLKRPSQLQEVLDIARKLLQDYNDLNEEILPTKESKTKLVQLKCVLEMYGHFSGINRKVQIKYQPQGKPKSSSTEDVNCIENDPSLLLILKWGGELTSDGKSQAEDLGTAFRKLYPGGEGNNGFLRLHSTYRHDLKIYASDEGRVQMTAAAFAKGLLALDGELAPILFQMVKSANTNGLLDNDSMSAKWQNEAKTKLREYLKEDKELTREEIDKIDPTNNFSIRTSLEFIKNPVEMCRKVYEYVKELVKLIRIKITDGKYYDLKLYHDESWELMLRRWSKLEKDFYNSKKNEFEISKIPDIFDSIKYDLMHNRTILNFDNAYNLYNCTKALADVVIPQEYGLTKEEKLKIAQGIVTPLLKKIRADLKSNLTGIWNCEDDIINQLDPSYSKGIHTPGRHVRTRLYFTSESHIYSLLTVLKFGNLFEDNQDEQWKNALNYTNTVPELNYLTQIVIMLYEDPSVDADSDKRFHVELHFSPGSYADFDAPKYLNKSNANMLNDDFVEETLYNSSGSEGFSPHVGVSPKRRGSQEKRVENNKKSPLSNLVKKYPLKMFGAKELQTLPEPNDLSSSLESKNNVVNPEPKPRSFEDEHHQNKIQAYKGKFKQKEPYNHYNTFHGSTNNYLSINHIFRNKFLNMGTNSSPDLNQSHGRPKRSIPTIYQDLIKVRYMRPLETLHNNLCFKNLNNFLTRMINDSSSTSNVSNSQNKLRYSVSSANNLASLESMQKVNDNMETIDFKESDLETAKACYFE
ncbi:unnamed protein product [Brachionus calyciflorus]|uniref:Inositol hexakisphosphate and diphosphoinositol-pentakisphosphate kinase n=1 Tax=Brachionus calyciflorus TaxID=104777 RepID=A0A813UBZ5_9BILA|nr:unnamed protein product [Brachionus calyciflorus]